jgi:hypothetical protein
MCDLFSADFFVRVLFTLRSARGHGLAMNGLSVFPIKVSSRAMNE